MPIHLWPVTRRRFLAASAASLGAWYASPGQADEAKPIDPDRFALLADTHIPADPGLEARGANMTANLRSVVAQLLAAEQRSQAALILGDCAYLKGQQDDYRQLAEVLAPLGKAAWSVHLALGNHDHRQQCAEAFPTAEGALQAQVERRVAVLPGRRANWFLLDSLDQVNQTPGALGERQLRWLAEALDQHTDKPALIGVHHNPFTETLPNSGVKGLVDSPALFDVVDRRRHVKAIFFGHTHSWSVVEHAGIHLVNLPPVAYVFAKDKPNGWVDCRLEDDRAELTMHCHDPARAEHGRAVELRWRKA